MMDGCLSPKRGTGCVSQNLCAAVFSGSGSPSIPHPLNSVRGRLKSPLFRPSQLYGNAHSSQIRTLEYGEVTEEYGDTPLTVSMQKLFFPDYSVNQGCSEWLDLRRFPPELLSTPIASQDSVQLGDSCTISELMRLLNNQFPSTDF